MGTSLCSGCNLAPVIEIGLINRLKMCGDNSPLFLICSVGPLGATTRLIEVVHIGMNSFLLLFSGNTWIWERQIAQFVAQPFPPISCLRWNKGLKGLRAWALSLPEIHYWLPLREFPLVLGIDRICLANKYRESLISMVSLSTIPGIVQF